MTLTRRRSDRSTVPTRDAFFDWVFRDPWTSLFVDGERLGSATLPLDMKETDDEYVIEAELPGIKPEDAEVTLDGRMLTIRGSYSEARESGEKGERYLMKERRQGSVVRSITLPSTVDPDRVSSTFEDGELKVTLPKSAASRARRIPIGPGQGAKQVGSS